MGEGVHALHGVLEKAVIVGDVLVVFVVSLQLLYGEIVGVVFNFFFFKLCGEIDAEAAGDESV